MSEVGRCSLAVGGDGLKVAGRSPELSGEVCVWTAGRALHVEVAQAELGGEGGWLLQCPCQWGLDCGLGLVWGTPMLCYPEALTRTQSRRERLPPLAQVQRGQLSKSSVAGGLAGAAEGRVRLAGECRMELV